MDGTQLYISVNGGERADFNIVLHMFPINNVKIEAKFSFSEVVVELNSTSFFNSSRTKSYEDRWVKGNVCINESFESFEFEIEAGHDLIMRIC